VIKIGLVTFFKSCNYGVWLQAYATQQFLLNLGYDVEIINYCNEFENAKLKYAYKEGNSKFGYITSFLKSFLFGKVRYYNKGFKRNINKYYRLSKEYSSIKDMENLEYDVLIVGSDQVWNPLITNGLEDVFLLNFGGKKKKISFASSMGSSSPEGDEERKLLNALNDFSSISVREEFAKEYLENRIQKDIKVVLDPTFMLDRNYWVCHLAEKSKYYTCEEKYILTYFISYEKYKEECVQYVEDYAKKMNLPVYSIQFSRYFSKGNHKKILGASISDFVALMMNADLVITDSFHGTAMSINMNKSFVVWNNSNNPARIINLLDKLDLSSRIKMNPNDYSVVDFSLINKKIDELRSDAITWLKKSIDE